MNPDTEHLIKQFKALADPLRMRIVALCSQGECSVSELTEVLAQSQPRISQHLKLLCESGLLERFRDGHFVFFRLPAQGDGAAALRRLLALLPVAEPEFDRDIAALRDMRGASPAIHSAEDRPLHHALVELTVSTPLGDLLDIGSGQGRILKLLASRAQRAVGVDIDADARRFARAEVLLAGLPNCTLRQGDMYSLPFEDCEFDTVIIDDVLVNAVRPVDVLVEALRLIKPGGRLLVLTTCDVQDSQTLTSNLAAWCHEAGLRLSPPRSVPANQPRWLLAVATRAEPTTAAA
jgi:ArsR family transcriptional regulator